MTVSIVKTTNPEDVRKAIDLLGGIRRFVEEGDKVIVKPNICIGKPSNTGAVTDPEVVGEICRMVEECGANPTVAESPIYPFSGRTVFLKSKYAKLEAESGYPVINLDRQEEVHVRVPRGRAISHTVIAKPILECDKLINVPVMKTHMEAIVTLGLKNLKGAVVGKHKHIIHLAGLNQGIADLNTIIRSDLTVVDGIIGMEGELGPISGSPAHMGVIVAGDNVVEVDATCTRIMGADPTAIAHIRLAEEMGLGYTKNIEIVGEPLENVQKQLRLPKRSKLAGMLVGKIFLPNLYRLANPLLRTLGKETVDISRKLKKVVIDYEKCTACKICVEACPVSAMHFSETQKQPNVDEATCIQCFCCAEACTEGAISKG